VLLRQAIEKQMNKIESANKFSRAVSQESGQELPYGEKAEQEIAGGCRRLIRNAIICWNYLYLSQKIAEEKNEDRRNELIAAVKNGSVAAWRHVNMSGEFDLSDERLRDSVGLNIQKILRLNLSLTPSERKV
jgi:cytochrome c551/c552